MSNEEQKVKAEEEETATKQVYAIFQLVSYGVAYSTIEVRMLQEQKWIDQAKEAFAEGEAELVAFAKSQKNKKSEQRLPDPTIDVQLNEWLPIRAASMKELNRVLFKECAAHRFDCNKYPGWECRYRMPNEHVPRLLELLAGSPKHVLAQSLVNGAALFSCSTPCPGPNEDEY